jgi:pimeloyl-ACP methyl ester carboxylesterase
MEPARFEIAVPEAELTDLRDRLARTRFADDFANDEWRLGVPGPYLRELVDHWMTAYDWRAHEARMNALPNFRVELDGVPVHFVHVRGPGPAPLPLVLTHGWPWTFWDYEQVIGPLTDPAAHGGDAEDAFDVIVPSLPGTAFSGPLEQPVGVLETTALWLRLMRDVLGYERFGVGGGDSGAFVSARLGHSFPEHVVGVHLTFPATVRFGDYGDLRPDDYTDAERPWAEDLLRQGERGTAAHMAVHIEDPQTLAWAMNDSPAGLAAWLVERRRNWSDCDGDVERRFTKDDLLTTASLFWLTQTFHTSVRFYAESYRSPWPLVREGRPHITVPTGVAVFPRELLRMPRAFMAREANITHWTVMPRGGHFAPAEEPALVVDDLRAFFRPLR